VGGAAEEWTYPARRSYLLMPALEAGVLDELEIQQSRAVRGGRRLFEVLPSRVELEIVRVIDTPEATHTSTTASVAEPVDRRPLGRDIATTTTTRRHQRGHCPRTAPGVPRQDYRQT